MAQKPEPLPQIIFLVFPGKRPYLSSNRWQEGRGMLTIEFLFFVPLYLAVNAIWLRFISSRFGSFSLLKWPDFVVAGLIPSAFFIMFMALDLLNKLTFIEIALVAFGSGMINHTLFKKCIITPNTPIQSRNLGTCSWVVLMATFFVFKLVSAAFLKSA